MLKERNGHSKSELLQYSESRPETEGCLGISSAKKRETPAHNYKKLDQKLIRHLKTLVGLMNETLRQGWREGNSDSRQIRFT